jgi:hypothetical protein
MTKSELLKNSLKKRAIIFIIAVGACTALAYGAYMFSMSNNEEKQRIESELRQKSQKVSELEQKFNIYEASFNRYNEILKEFDNKRYALDIPKAQALINDLRQKYRLTNLELTISGEKPYGEANASYKGFEPLYREISLAFYGLSDAHVYAFMEELQRSLSGYIRFAAFSVSRQRGMSEELYKDARRGSTPSVVKSEVSFLWIGVARKKADATAQVEGQTP